MDQQDDDGEDNGEASKRRFVIAAGTSAIALVLLGGVVMLLLSGDKDPPRKVQEFTIVNVLPPPPPPPPPPQTPPEQKMVEQTPVKQEIVEQQPVDNNPKPADAKDDPLPGPPALDAAGDGPGDLLGKPGGRGLIGGGGGGGGGGGRWGYYASIVQTQIEAALRSNKRTRNAVMEIKIRLWAEGTGRVSRVQLVSSTGDAELDAAIRDEVLGGLTLREPPPKDMPMPIITRVIARKSG